MLPSRTIIVSSRSVYGRTMGNHSVPSVYPYLRPAIPLLPTQPHTYYSRVSCAECAEPCIPSPSSPPLRQVTGGMLNARATPFRPSLNVDPVQKPAQQLENELHTCAHRASKGTDSFDVPERRAPASAKPAWYARWLMRVAGPNVLTTTSTSSKVNPTSPQVKKRRLQM